jgi:hypothetical protein
MHPPRFQKFVEFLIDNLFDIATIVVAGFIVVRYEIRPPTQADIPELATWILAVLGLTAVSGLWDRNRRLNRIEKLSEEGRDLAVRHLSGRVRAADFFRTKRELPEQALASATTIFLSGVTLTRTTRECMHILSQRLVAGAYIRIMIADPSIDAVLRELALRDGDLTAEEYRTRLQAVQAVIGAIAETPESKGTVEVGYLPNAPIFGLVVLNPDQPHGVCLVEFYHHRSAVPTATFELQAADDPFWYKFFRQQYEILWGTCRIERLPRMAESAN